jgi:hypothetical protein
MIYRAHFTSTGAAILVLLAAVLPYVIPQQARAQTTFTCATDTTAVLDPGGDTIAFEDSVHALVVLVRFRDDTTNSTLAWPGTGSELPGFADGIVEGDPADVRTSILSAQDSSLSAYFVWQSHNGPRGPHVLSGEVWPHDPTSGDAQVYVTANDREWYYNDPADPPEERRGFGFIVQEVLDSLVYRDSIRFDIGRFDANRDNTLDHMMVLVRFDGTWGAGGQASLVGPHRGHSDGWPPGELYYPSTLAGGSIHVHRHDSGQQSVLSGSASRSLIIHEYGHDLYLPSHTQIIRPGSNDVPYVSPPATGKFACAYNRMCGIFTSLNTTDPDSNYDPAAETLSGWEMRRMGWADRRVLIPANGDVAGVIIDDLYTSGEIVLVPLAHGAATAPDTLLLEYRTGSNYFDADRPQISSDPGQGVIMNGLSTSGLLATLTRGTVSGSQSQYDVLYADNEFVISVRCNGTGIHAPTGQPYCPLGLTGYDGDMFGPPTATQAADYPQITPWTRPNVSGFTFYPNDTAYNWFAVDSIRYVPNAADSSMAFDFYANYLDPGAGNRSVIRADSWMGNETDDQTFVRPVVVTNGATLTIWQEPTIDFAAGLTVEPGARLVVEPGVTLRFAPGKYLTVDGDIEVNGTATDPVTFTRQNSGAAWGGLVVRGGGIVHHGRVYGADTGVETSAPALFIHDSHIAANSTGILTDYALVDEQLVRSFMYVENSCVSENTAEGLTARHANIAIVGSAVEDNDGGMSLLNADVAPVYDSRIAGNGIGASVGATGELVLFDPGEVVHGHNRVHGNTGLELAAGEGSTLLVGVEGIGQNRVTDSGGVLIRNEASGTLPARETWWGSTSGPPAGAFIGSVDSKDHLTSDASEPGPTCPSLSFGEGGAYAIAAPTARRPLADGDAAGVTGASADPTVYYAALRREIVAARERTQQAASRPESMHADSAAAVVWRLAALQGLDRRDTLREAGASEAVLASVRELLGQGELHPTTRAASESALLAAIDGRLAASDAAGAEALLEWGSPRSQRPAMVRGLTLRRAILDERARRRAEAAAAYNAEAERLEAAEFPELAALYRRQAALTLRAGRRGEAGVSGAATAISTVALALGPARPNPTTGVTVLPLSLPAAADVQAAAYDALGRRVATLASGRLEPGTHDLSLDGAGLAPGVYVVRVLVDGDRPLTRRVTVVR